MSNFWNIVAFEYKKIFGKKSVKLTLLLGAAVMVFSCCTVFLGSYYVEGNRIGSQYERMLLDREFARALSGRPVDTELMMETAEAYSKIPDGTTIYGGTPEYDQYARPYSPIWLLMRQVYSTPDKRMELEDVKAFTPEQGDQFYDIVQKEMDQGLEEMNITQRQKDKLAQWHSQVETPYIYQYADGYEQFSTILYSSMLIACFIAVVCVAPIFAGEYTSKVSQLILSAKKGKTTVVSAKIFTGVTVGALLAVASVAMSYGIIMAIYGADGATRPIQLLSIGMYYNLTMGQLAIAQAVCGVAAGILTAGATMLLSAKMKTPFGVLGIMGVVLVAPMFINSDAVWVNRIRALLPGEMSAGWSVLGDTYEVFGVVFPPYLFLPLFAVLVAAVAAWFAHRGFQKHQGV